MGKHAAELPGQQIPEGTRVTLLWPCGCREWVFWQSIRLVHNLVTHQTSNGSATGA